MKKNIKIILIILLLIIGIILILYGIYNYLGNQEQSSNNSLNIEENDANQEQYISEEKTSLPITNYSADLLHELEIDNFYVNKSDSNKLIIKYDLINNTENVISNKQLEINFYNQEDLIYTYVYQINELEINDAITIESELDIEYQDITKNEVVVDQYKTEIKLNE